ncbi:MAG: argininosuccinate synthase [Candidatus Peregrinibacteria bacterium]|nr:argininosuccinate synthase [Candidatus Peregrinibacteria bacterium]MDZ4245372.1 argininosuccinate synthase [Candidatus Gracilibacteria bacterium]
MKKVILAFSGGLDTSFCVPYLKEKGYQVITITVNTGGFTAKQLKEIAHQAKKLGSHKHFEVDAQEALFEKFASYIIKANYLKGGVYPACVGPERNIIALEIAKIAKQENIECVAHGSTAAGNDQVRFDLALSALLPNCTILAPIRDEELTREQEVAFLKKIGVHIDSGKKDYSINVGLLGTTIGGKETLGTKKTLPECAFPLVKSLEEAQKQSTLLEIEFANGLPLSLNGKEMNGVKMINELNEVAAACGFGKDYHIGTTILGTKGRIGFEAPAMKIFIKAHSELEKLTLTSKQIFWKNILGTLYGDLIHEGLYFDPIVKNLEAFLDSANEFVSGKIKLKMQKGLLIITFIESPYSLLNSKFGAYGEKAGAWTGIDAKGFCKLYGLESVNAFLTHKQHD